MKSLQRLSPILGLTLWSSLAFSQDAEIQYYAKVMDRMPEEELILCEDTIDALPGVTVSERGSENESDFIKVTSIANQQTTVETLSCVEELQFFFMAGYVSTSSESIDSCAETIAEGDRAIILEIYRYIHLIGFISSIAGSQSIQELSCIDYLEKMTIIYDPSPSTRVGN